MRLSINGPEEIIKWSRRLLFLSLFLLLMIVYPLWRFSITLPFVMAIVTLIVTALVVVDEPKNTKEEDIRQEEHPTHETGLS